MIAAKSLSRISSSGALLFLATVSADAQSPKSQGGGSFRVQSPSTTPLHPLPFPMPISLCL